MMFEIFENVLFVYISIYIMAFIFMAIASFVGIMVYNNTKFTIKDEVLLTSNNLMGVSVIAPAFNEEKTIVENVKSLLSLNYPNFEVIIINDGSSDNTLNKLIHEFELEKVNFYYNERIKSQKVRGHYKSRNPIYARLLVVDKINGKSKADASNAGINSSQFPLFICTDVDCILRSDTILKLVKAIMSSDRHVIAAGAAIRASNSCEVIDGFLIKKYYPKNWWASFQELEYIRAFLLGRMAWSQINGLLLVSGGLGIFDKEVAIEAGGYWHKSLGEDLDLVIRMRKVMHRKKKEFRIKYIPESLCWTEVPSTFSVFKKQRVRWGRGLFQTLLNHKLMMFNPKYGRTGLLLLPYFLLFEFLVPILELIGLIAIIVGLIFFNMDVWPILKVTGIAYLFYLVITLLTVLWDEWIFGPYSSYKDLLSLILKAILEPIVYHPVSVYCSLKGYWDFFLKKEQKWGVMERKGFENPKKKAA